ncbi:uncharacterized protein LOC125028281 [Penaeus chinensis]|uniref:uncharacterized protein LOC125028281 n=1 Tax=Penaeus chinensis TaxID=139456 RepID=UPI001FB8480F|nr:uncharacterized protein LOC125028281 [Penaeus chinensis]XP_047473678.1 uncharacterized protein LOC125028281 [Penaeus chinensis]
MPKHAKTWATKKAKNMSPLSVSPCYQRAESEDATEQKQSPGIARDKTLPYAPSRSPSPKGLLSPFESNIFPQTSYKTSRSNSVFLRNFLEKSVTPRKVFPLKSGLLADNKQLDTLHSAKSIEDYLIRTQKTVVLRPTSPDSQLGESLCSNSRPSRSLRNDRPSITLRNLLSADLSPEGLSNESLRVNFPDIPPKPLLRKETTVSLPEADVTENSIKTSWNTVSRSSSCDSKSLPTTAPFRPPNSESGRRERACRVCGWIDCPLDDTRVSTFLHQLYPKLQL